MDVPALNVAHTEEASTTTEASGSHALVQHEAIEPSKSAIKDPVALFDEGTKRWRLVLEGQNM